MAAFSASTAPVPRLGAPRRPSDRTDRASASRASGSSETSPPRRAARFFHRVGRRGVRPPAPHLPRSARIVPRASGSGSGASSGSPDRRRGAAASDAQLEMDLVWDGALPKYLQHAGRSQDESDSDSDDEDDPDGLAAPEQPVVRSSPLGSASNTATAAAAKEAASRRRERERSKTRGARKEERRLGGSGGSYRSSGASSGASSSDAFADPSSLASAASSLAASTPTVDPNAPSSSSSSSTSSYEYSDGDPVWDIICTLARRDAEAEPLLSSYMYTSVLSHETLEQALSFVLANRLADSTLLPTQLMEIFNSVLFADDADGVYIRSALRADVRAIRDRDPACASYVHALLYLKGFHALQAHRIQHALWKRGQKLLALTMQARISTVFAMDLHPAARFGKGILIDHGTGVVVGETAVVGDNVSVLQGVTLGGTGKEAGDRHPKIGRGVLIGAHSTILGNITIGRGAMIAAGSLVLKPVPARTTVAGAPAKVVGTQTRENPSMEMCQDIDEETGRDQRTGEVCVPEEEEEGEEGLGGGEGGGGEVTETETGGERRAGGAERRARASLADKMPDDAGFDI